MVQMLDPDRTDVQGLVVTPTRELAKQVASAIHGYGRQRGVRVIPIYGGQSYSRQIGRLRRGVHVVVGTPGRMLDLIEKRALKLDGVQFAVLDEADEMLSMGFVEDIQAVLQATPETRQTALFSATLPASIRRLADEYMHEPRTVSTSPKQMTVDSIEQRTYLVNEPDKVALLTRLLELENVTSALIFARTKVGAGVLASTLTNVGFKAETLHGDLDQSTRESVLGRFRHGQTLLLVATDVAARGLDIKGVSHVINYDLPNDPEYYVHRIGRTGRAGQEGVAITLITPRERRRMARIEQYVRKPIARTPIPTAAQVLKQRDEEFLDRLADQLAGGELARERALIAGLAESGLDPLDLAAAAIQLAREDEQQRPVVDIAPPMPPARKRDRRRLQRGRTHAKRPRVRKRNGNGHEPGMVRLSMNLGRSQSLAPGEVVGAIAGTARIPGRSIGAIDIHKNQAFVDVAEAHADLILRKMKGWKLRGQPVVLQRAS
jgi:ATP-dependent RNA helicase DeaD